MKFKPLWCVSIATTPEAEDAVAEMLGATLSSLATSYFNVESGTSTATVYCEARPAAGVRKTIAAELVRIKKCGLKIVPGKLTIGKVRREDWAESWKRHFKPIEINLRRDKLSESQNSFCSGKSLLIKPSWSRKRPRLNQAVVVLDPGLSFGTGQHPTTAFCLEQLVRFASQLERRHPAGESNFPTRPPPAGCRRSHLSFLDIGTGSGILAITAAKLGYGPVDAFDFDANAVEIARVNARRNRVADGIRFWRGDVARLPIRPERKYNLVCANLISDLLIAERHRIAAQLNRSGTLVLAGILKSEFREVRRAFEKLRLKLVSNKAEKEWWSGAFQRLQIKI